MSEVARPFTSSAFAWAARREVFAAASEASSPDFPAATSFRASSRRSSAAMAYLAPNRGRANLTVRTDAQVRRLIIEAGVVQGWEGILGDSGVFIGMDDFGHSGKPAQVAEKVGFTVPAVMEKIARAGW